MSHEDLRWDADGLIPAVVQERETGEVLMVAWMNREALDATIATRRSHFWSRSRRELWRKGDTSGHAQHVDGVYADCDGDTLLVQVHQVGVACHTGARTCFFTRLGASQRVGDGALSTAVRAAASGDSEISGDRDAPAPADAPGPATLEDLERVLQSRKAAPPPGSYVAALLARGEAAICRKVGEEATEVITAALGGEGDDRVVSETADLVFHTMVLLAARGIPLRRVFAELARRHGERRAGG
jgi:phosphoribosyl-AMP cyclohydrolase / phosphoribosyl-ATP pyrophosphohydrolase